MLEPAGADAPEADTPAADMPAAAPGVPARRTPRGWAGVLAYPLGAFVASRLVLWLVAVFGTYLRRDTPIQDWFAVFDGGWYAQIVQRGYPRSFNFEHGKMLPNAVAFFPGYPLVARGLRWLPLGDAGILILVSLVFGAAATVLVWLTAEHFFGRETADGAALLFVFSPGAFLLSSVYSEAMVIAFAAATLLALVRKRWVVAGVCAAIGTATRPNALVLIAVCALASAIAIREDRDWRSLVAPALSPLGAVAFFAFLWQHTGEPFAWFRVEHEAWHERIDWGSRFKSTFVAFLHHPVGSSPETLVGITAIVSVLALALVFVTKLPGTYKLYAAWMVLLPFVSEQLLPRPRWLFTAFPVVIAIAYFAGRRFTPLVAAVGATGMATLLLYYGSLRDAGIIPP